MGGLGVTESIQIKSIHSFEGGCYDKNIQKMKRRGERQDAAAL